MIKGFDDCEIIKRFFCENSLYKKENLKEFKRLFIEYINSNCYIDKDISISFIKCINDEIDRNISSKMKAIHSMTRPPSKDLMYSIRNKALTKWFMDSIEVYRVPRNSMIDLDKSIEPIIKHNQKVLVRSYLEAKNVVVK